MIEIARWLGRFLAALSICGSPAQTQEEALIRDHHEVIFESHTGRILLFGGNSRDTNGEYTYESSTWTLAEGSWELLDEEGPEPRSSFSMVYDSRRKQTLVFGGYIRGGAYDDTWIFDGQRWIEAQGDGPSARMSSALCFDPESGLSLLFGGRGRGSYQDTWAWDGERWSKKSDGGPSGRSRAAMYYDSKRKRVFLYGGFTGGSGESQRAGDMWAWTGESWEEIEQGMPKPPPLSNHRVVYDTDRNVAVLFGGSAEHGTYLDQTWEWDGEKWAERQPETRPAPRGNFSMTYHPILKRTILHGGKNSQGETLSDLWSWDGETWRPDPVLDVEERDALLTPQEYYSTLLEAEKLLAKQAYEDARVLLDKLIKTCGDDGSAWMALAQCHSREGNHRKTRECLERASELGSGQPTRNAFFCAQLSVLLDERDAAVRWLEQCLSLGWENRQGIASDAILTRLNQDPRWPELTGELPSNLEGRDEGWRFDLAYLAKELKRLHVDPFGKISEVEFDDRVAELHQRIPDLTAPEIFVAMQKIVRSIDDGHTVLYRSSKKVSFLEIPIKVHFFPEGLFIVDADPEYRNWIGSEIVRFEETDTEEVIRSLDEIVSRDNPMGIKWLGPRYLVTADILQGLKIAKPSDHIRLTLVDREGKKREISAKLKPQSRRNNKMTPSLLEGAPPAPLYLGRVQENFWLQMLEDHVLYIQFNQVRDKRGQSLAKFAKRVWQTIEEEGVRNVILDLRHNNGGNSKLTPPLLKALIAFETTRPEGRIFALIGRNTFSAAMNFTTDLDRLTDVIFVGEPSGSSPNFVGEETDLYLPYSGTRGSISSLRWQFSWPEDERIWIAPEIPVSLTAADYFSNLDPALDAIRSVIRTDRE